jgi:hypothetical protein
MKARKPDEGQKAIRRPESHKKARKPEEGQKAKISHEFHVNNVQRTEKSKLSDMRKTGDDLYSEKSALPKKQRARP